MQLLAKQHNLRVDRVRLTGAPPMEGTAARAATGPENQGISAMGWGFDSSTFRHACDADTAGRT